MTPLHIREAESADFDWLFALKEASYRAHVEAIWGAWDPADQRARFVKAFADPRLRVLESAGAPIGSLTVDWDDDPVVLADIEILPDRQGQGWGTRVVREVIGRARARGRDVVLQVMHPNPARSLYTRLGFEETSRSKTHVRMRWDGTPQSRRALKAACEPWDDPERRDAWFYDVLDTAASPAIEFLRFVAARHGLPAELDVLDLGCGTGRLFSGLRAQGWTVTGLEPHAGRLEGAKRRAGRFSGVRALPGGFAELSDERAYDLVATMNGPWAYLLTPDDRRRAAANVARALRPHGTLVVDMPSFPWILRNYREPVPTTVPWHDVMVSRISDHDFDFHDATLLHRDTLVVERDGETVAQTEAQHRFGLFGLPELVDALVQGGLGDIETFTGLSNPRRGRCIGRRIVLTARLGR